MTAKPARGPQPVTRRDGTTAWSSGTVHTWLIHVRDLCRRPTQAEARTNDASPEPVPEYDLYRQALQDAGTRR